MGVLVAQSCPTLCNPMDCSPPGSSIHGILQARTLEWAVIPFSMGSSWLRIEHEPPTLQVDSLPLSHQGSPRMSLIWVVNHLQMLSYHNSCGRGNNTAVRDTKHFLKLTEYKANDYMTRINTHVIAKILAIFHLNQTNFLIFLQDWVLDHS